MMVAVPFISLSAQFCVAGQLTAADIARAQEENFSCIVNNRPDHESPDQPEGKIIAEEARHHGLRYVAIPIDHKGFMEDDVAIMADLLYKEHRILAFCRSGSRSAHLYALAAVKNGKNPEEILQIALAAGYDLQRIRPLLHRFHQLSEK